MSAVYLKTMARRTTVGQGDIIHMPAKGVEKPRWGFIITADCDIFKDKAGASLSFLNIVTAAEYLENIWSAEVLRKYRPKFLEESVSLVRKAAQDIDENLNILSHQDIIDWLIDAPKEEIVSSLGISSKNEKKYSESLEKVELSFGIRGDGRTPLQRLRRVWAIQGLKDSAILGRLKEALDYNQATDFHFLPEIPDSEPLGYVVLLREVSSVPHDHIHPSALALQIDGSPEGYYLVGPSTDNLRYAISQKMAFLFSRIGMSEEFESKCGIASQLALDEIASAHGIAGANQ